MKTLKDRILNKTNKTKTCWLWIGAKSDKGYGLIRENGSGISKILYAHRAAWQTFQGKIPKGMCVLHKCDNPLCIRPAHLWIGTQTENILDMDRKGRRRVLRGEEIGMSKLSQSQILKIRSMYASGNYTQKEIGDEYHMTHRAIGNIVNRKTWKHI